MDICERLKTRLKALFSFFLLFAKVDQKFCNGAENIPVQAGRLVVIFRPTFNSERKIIQFTFSLLYMKSDFLHD